MEVYAKDLWPGDEFEFICCGALLYGIVTSIQQQQHTKTNCPDNRRVKVCFDIVGGEYGQSTIFQILEEITLRFKVKRPPVKRYYQPDKEAMDYILKKRRRMAYLKNYAERARASRSSSA